MSSNQLERTLAQLSDTLERAQLLLPQTAQDVDWTAQAYVWQVRYGRGFLQALQNIQQGIAVFAARQAHHHAVAGFNHVEIVNGIAGVVA